MSKKDDVRAIFTRYQLSEWECELLAGALWEDLTLESLPIAPELMKRLQPAWKDLTRIPITESLSMCGMLLQEREVID